jgi:CheY-like chemotaxis protein
MLADCISGCLRVLGAEVRVAYSGPSALGICEQWRPTSVLMDVNMPGMGGCEVARRMRERFPLDNLRLIALSGRHLHENDDCAGTAGFALGLIKPVQLDELVAALLR